MLNKKLLIFSFILLFSLTFISAEDFGYNYLEGDLDIQTAINYSTINVNNSQFLRGYSPTTLRAWMETYFDDIYYNITNPSNYYNSSDFSISDYVPYTGASSNLDLGSYNITASNFIGDGSQLTNISGLSQWITTGDDIYYNDGKVGIGTDNPGAKLDVYGNALLGDDWTSPGERNTNQLKTFELLMPNYDTSKLPLLAFRGIARSTSAYVTFGSSTGNYNGFNDLLFFTTTDTTTPTGNTEKMRIDKDGNVGINTTTPQNTLNVIGDINATEKIFTQNIEVSGQLNLTNGSHSNQIYTDENGTLVFYIK